MKNYEELIKTIKAINNQEKQIEFLFNYLLNNLQYDYLYLEITKLVKLANEKDLSFSDLYEEDLVDATLNQFSKHTTIPQMVVDFFKNKEYEDVPAGYITKPAKDNGGIITKGVCIHFSNFIKKVCDDIGIKCEVRYGTTPLKHAWNLIEIKNKCLNYDITYALYSKDKYSNWHTKTKPESWFGVTDKQLLTLHPEREFDPIYDAGVTRI